MGGIDTVTWAGAGSVPAQALRERTALVVISNPGAMPPLGGRHRLDLAFWDAVDPDLADRMLLSALGGKPTACVRLRGTLRGDGGWPWRPPMSADAHAIRGFVAGLPRDVRSLHVACEFGKSRSRAVAEWVARERGCDASGDTSGAANPVLAGLLRRLRLPPPAKAE